MTALTHFHLSATASPENEPALYAAFAKHLRPLLEGQDLLLASAVWRLNGETIVAWEQTTTTGHREVLHRIAQTLAMTFPSPVRVVLSQHGVSDEGNFDFLGSGNTTYVIEDGSLVVTTSVVGRVPQVDRVPLPAAPAPAEYPGPTARVRDFVEHTHESEDYIETAFRDNGAHIDLTVTDLRDVLNELDATREALESYELAESRGLRADRNHGGN